MEDSFAARRRRILDALQSDYMQRPNAPIPSLPGFDPTLPAGLSPYTQGYNQRLPSMLGGQMQNPSIPMGGGLAQLGNTLRAPGFGQMPIPAQSMSPNMPAPNAVPAGPASVPMPPERPMSFPAQSQAAPMPPQRPEGLGFNDPNATVQGFNPLAFGGNAQAYADQFAGGDLSKLSARTYRNEDGSMWNDYYLTNPGG